MVFEILFILHNKLTVFMFTYKLFSKSIRSAGNNLTASYRNFILDNNL